ncbi:ABC transporter ATP-binding protein [Xanthobacter sp. V4C-4]|uniref:ABC transporter ATP-binding protein n=1 Tax=Xanthobacter cornucopiae TaxID=3119924 RepID=UPI003728C491
MITPLLSIERLGKAYAAATAPAVLDAAFEVRHGEIFTLIGPSGCGKSTLLRMIAGFETPDTGVIRLEGRDITTTAPEHRRIGIVFQDYALFPHLSVIDNVAFALRGRPKAERREQALQFLAKVRLDGVADRFPDQLSGGQQQRVALARSLAGMPRLILLDEPFSNLDAALRVSTRREIRDILRENGVGAVFVTHDQEEALSFADRVAVMRHGRIEQIGAPEEVYARPVNAFVAGFLGRTNLVPAEARAATALTVFGEVALATPADGPVLLSLRPEQLVLDAVAGGAGEVVAREFKGHDVTFWVRHHGLELQVDAETLSPFRPGDRVRIAARAPAVVVAHAPAPAHG